MPSFEDWLKASWDDFRGRWGALLAVLGTSGALVIVAVFIPLLIGGLVAATGLGPAWACIGGAVTVSMAASLWLSTWAQAAATRASMFEETAGQSLSRAWDQTSAFAWVVTLAMLTACGGFFLLVLPGFLVSVLFFFAPFFVLNGEGEGLKALDLSWRRVRPRFGLVATRVTAAGLIAAAPGWIPYVGWIIGMFWAPIGLVALARLAKDLREVDHDPAPLESTAIIVWSLSAVCVLGLCSTVFMGVRAVNSAVASFNESGGIASRVRPETLQALSAAMEGSADGAQKLKALERLYQDVKTPPQAAP